ncbi:SDR family NAD(P)-dependent oxidoreductase [Tianweitania populi]|uniref:Short-chain dehydrogenase n=1 Tax=Tianweitania populi TaxID=1607949 RepID=A0A8J3E016_9HYPH|nr:SDR family NAD(P)-dependent oxidoreductase [Tianweitania populi]GHD20590.1 short-chain dehydrogenase [Tianweitania populi]
MVEPLQKPGRKNPLDRTRQQALPPAGRSRKGQLLTLAAAQGRFALQCCSECGLFCYPARDACPNCLSADLPLTDAPNGGTIVSETTVRVPTDVYFRERASWRIGIVKLDCGPEMVAHLHADCYDGERVRMSLQLDKSGQAVAFARPTEKTPNQADDRQWREMTATPKFRRALVTNGRTALGQAVAAALKAAGAEVYVGLADPWKPFPGEETLKRDHHVVPLDVADERSVQELAADLGGKIDILVNSTEHVRPGGLLDRRVTNAVKDEMDQHHFGFVHLAQAFGPAMRARGADGVNSAAAWVNVFSVYALANWAPFGTNSAAQAAALSLSHCLRGELRLGGVRVVNLFTGPLDTEWFQTVPPPKLAPKAVASAIVAALENGTEDVFVGDVAEDVRQRLLANPKALERDLNQRIS